MEGVEMGNVWLFKQTLPKGIEIDQELKMFCLFLVSSIQRNKMQNFFRVTRAKGVVFKIRDVSLS